MKRVILLALAVILAVAVLAGVLIVRSQAGTAKPTAAKHVVKWTTYRDPLGLYMISYPTSWKASDGGTSGEWLITIVGHDERFLAVNWDTLSLTDSANIYAAIDIDAIELNTPQARTYFCRPDKPTSWANLPLNGIDFATGNAEMKIHIGSSAFEEPIPAEKPTVTAEVHAALSPSTYDPILATFHSLGPKGSVC